MGTNGSKACARKVDCSTSNTSLSDLRYIVTEKPKWKVFKKTEIKAVPNRCHEGLVPDKGCNCGKFEPCRQRVTPKGVTIHYPKKTKKNKKPKPLNKKGHSFNFSLNFGTPPTTFTK
ncbi:uncharacterized protein LOC133531098 [Cydia pomonella]|uniref:uncharacterized protein LOC133531098 n=1 Tax=Cydia pomonella TaxID=82600 RepID=UPI002ADDAEBF|nr:uncharacterized protein LOC133531098 [Cydia pomonella]